MSPAAVAVPPITSTPSAISSVLNNPISSKPALIAPEPAHCPGPESSSAGTSSACAGCPNQSICASQKPKGPDPDIPAISSRLAGVKHKILVLSGKGGVGKSTFSCLLARAFASSSSSASGPDDDDYDDALVSVGLMDADVCGPSIPRMMGVEGESFHVSASGWSPVMAADNLAVMSIQFMLQDRDSAVIWRGPKKNGLLKQFLRDVEWGDLDFLVVDTPPGTSDEHLSLNALLKDTSGGIDGAVVVTTPQEVALLDVRKEIDFCRKAGIRVLGLVENMAGFVCPSCKFTSQIFKATTGGGEKLAKDMGLRFLGRMPLDPRIGMACDYGESFFDAYPDSPAAQALRGVVGGIADELGVEINIVDQDEE